MKNKEKFAKEIFEIACDGNSVAVDKRTGKIEPCGYLSCSNCLFNGSHKCGKAIRSWTESEYIKKSVISKRDRAFLEYFTEKRKYIARDKNGKLFVYETQPRKGEKYWNWIGDCCLSLNRHFNVDFPMIKWSDSEPWLIEDLKKLEVVEEYDE